MEPIKCDRCEKPSTRQCGFPGNDVCTTWLCDEHKHEHPKTEEVATTPLKLEESQHKKRLIDDINALLVQQQHINIAIKMKLDSLGITI